jgi:glycerol-3-phosphate acyltransferase PlsY
VASIGACLLLSVLSAACFAYNCEGMNIYVLVLSQLVAIFVIVKHKANMVRLYHGTENGFGKKRKA